MSYKPLSSHAVGDVIPTRDGNIRILALRGPHQVDVVFIDTGYRTTTHMSCVRNGVVKDYMRPRIAGIGFMGVGPYKTGTPREHDPAYRVWRNLLQRCYEPSGSRQAAYIGVTVCKAWHNYQNFAEWFWSQPNAGTVGFELDKDILGGGKSYSPTACALVPKELNMFFAGTKDAVGYFARNSGYTAQIHTAHGPRKIGAFATKRAATAAYRKAKLSQLTALLTKYDKVLDPRIKAVIIKRGAHPAVKKSATPDKVSVKAATKAVKLPTKGKVKARSMG